MPTYDYACRFCEHGFEHFQGLNDKKLRKCPACGRHGLERLFGIGAGVVFKGSGFYETDYKRPASADASKADASKQETGKTDAKEPGAGTKDGDSGQTKSPEPKQDKPVGKAPGARADDKS